MAKLPSKGEEVTWNTPQGETHGKVEKIVTGTAKIKNHTAKATKKEPQVLVKSGKSGKEAIHKPGELKKAS